MPFNPNASYRTVLDAEGQLYVSQGGKYYNRQGDELSSIPRTAQGYVAPVDHNTVAGFTSGTVSGVAVTGGSINNTPIGATTRNTLAGTSFALTTTDQSATPGNVTSTAHSGRAAFAAGTNSVTVTHAGAALADNVQVTLVGAADATLTAITGVTTAAGSFTVTGNATAAKAFAYLIVKA